MKPFIRWAGSKRQIVSRLRKFWSGGQRYIEPFAGSACLFFELEPAEALLGDLNWELILTMRAIQHDHGRVLEALRRLPTGEAWYYKIRSLDPRNLAELEIAARFLYLNRYCFNGLYRTNSSGSFNVPYGPPRSGFPVNETSISEASRVLRGALLLHADFEQTVSHAKSGDFVYLDPPYALSARRMFSEYLPGSFSTADLDRLGGLLLRLQRTGAAFVITYADSLEARRLLAEWHPRRIWTRRNIAGFSSKRRGSYELLATNIET
jgi:DNA adenine methylase